MSISTDSDRIHELLTRGVVEVIDEDSLRTKLLSGKQLRIKLGIDPTSKYVHLGRTIPLLKLRDFQELGHKVVLIIGDATAVIGDTSDKDSERPMLTPETIQENLQGYIDQIGKVLDIEQCEIRHNSEWLNPLGYSEIGEQANVFSINDFISRDNIKKRLDAGKRVSLREVLYPLMQGYDSVAVEADIELGATDQRFNVLAGRDLQRFYNQEPQDIVLNPLINGLDGRKMSSSWGNVVTVVDEPSDMFGKIMSLRDEMIIEYFTLLTRVPRTIISDYQQQLDGDANPKDIKMLLAKELVRMYHGDDAVSLAEQSWIEAFEHGGIPEDAKTVTVHLKVPLVDVLIQEGIVQSKSEFHRLVQEGALTFFGHMEERKIIDPKSLVEESGSLKVGKKRFLKLTVKKREQ